MIAEIGYRLATANVALCDVVQPGTGLVLHTIDAYDPLMRPSVRQFFKLVGNVGVEGVVPGSPADRAGIKPDDVVTAIGGMAIDVEPEDRATVSTLARLTDRIARLPADRVITVDIARNGVARSVSIHPVPICRARFELSVSSNIDASSDGLTVQITSALLAKVNRDEAAVVIAHELAHNILHHQPRLQAIGVKGGLMAGLGRNVRYYRQTETQADILSVYLLANAGYDPMAPVTFWNGAGKRFFSGLFSDRSHPKIADRVATMAREADTIAKRRERPILPAILDTRTAPLDGDWRSILIENRP